MFFSGIYHTNRFTATICGAWNMGWVFVGHGGRKQHSSWGEMAAPFPPCYIINECVNITTISFSVMGVTEL